ncbi:hypothetical protein [Streptomyces sp. CoH17]|uniref:hypothetical protein n=1 Tax=Streptomyces sp. CoH17 TaxID=2992806 RepID=UPI002D1E43FF|nr:hypothetical protein [Streptomyces sp. CoH17]
MPATPATTLAVTSTVQQLQRDNCVRWAGPATGEGIHIDEGIHVWTFTKVKGGTLVRTEETWTGDQAEADVDLSTQAVADPALLVTYAHYERNSYDRRPHPGRQVPVRGLASALER